MPVVAGGLLNCALKVSVFEPCGSVFIIVNSVYLFVDFTRVGVDNLLTEITVVLSPLAFKVCLVRSGGRVHALL